MFQVLFYTLLSDASLLLAILVGMLLMTVLTFRYGRLQIHRNQFLLFWLIFLFSCGLGYFYIRQVAVETDREQRQDIMEISRLCADTLTHGLIDHLDDDGAGSRQLQALLKSWVRSNDSIDTISVFRKSDNRSGEGMEVFFTTSKQDEPFPMKNEDYRNLLTDALHGNVACGKFVRSNGETYHVIAEPLIDGREPIRLVLCFEFDDWQDLIMRARIWPHLFFFAFLVFVVTTQLFFIRRRLFSDKLRDTRVIHYEKAFESLMEAQGSAKQDADEKNAFFALINTELKEPLIPILESAYLLLQQIRTESVGSNVSSVDWSFVDKILENQFQLQERLEDLRIFVNLEWNRLIMESKLFSPELMVNDFRKSCQTKAGEYPDTTFLVEIVKPVPRFILGDEEKIRYALERLVNWIVPDIPGGHLKLTCSVSDDQLSLDVSVSDKSPLTMPRAETIFFSGFQSSHDLLVAPEKKFDFGMQVASRLVQFLGGSTTVHPALGRRRKYSIVIPIEPAGETESPFM